MKKEVLRQLKTITQHAVDVIGEEELLKKLETSLAKKTPLKVKIGFDPTARDIHLGHTLLLRTLRNIQDLGHTVYFIVGDFTARIGDPSGRYQLRPVLTEKEIQDNAKTYTSQAFKILNKHKTKVVFNSIWYKNMNLTHFSTLLSHYTVARLLERDDFAKRIKENKPLSMLELIYPLIQGYDSVKLEADIEFGGTDQKFNLIVGRHLQESYGQKPQAVITMPLLVGLDGVNKMSKSLGNYVGITEDANSMFGKLMSISDELMWDYFHLLTDYDLIQMRKKHPKEAKLLLSETIVSCYHSPQKAKKARDEFERVFSKRKLPSEILEYKTKDSKVNIIEVLHASGLVTSKNEARRLLQQKGISAKGEVITNEVFIVNPQGVVLKVGKKRFLKIVLLSA